MKEGLGADTAVRTVFQKNTGAGQKGGISADALKVIAMVTMLIDHTGAVLFPETLWLRLIGRVSYPIFVWLLVMGFTHTSNLKKYMLRMGIFALLSEVPFDLAFSGRLTVRTQNIYFTLLLSLFLLTAMKAVLDRPDGPDARLRGLAVAGLMIATSVISELLGFDYGCMGPVLAAMFYLHVRTKKPGLPAGFFLFCLADLADPLLNGRDLMNPNVWSSTFDAIVTEAFGAVALPFISRCNGVRKWKRGKNFFYLFYPLHLLLLYAISQAVQNGMFAVIAIF